jgi:hypothetical protein
MKAAPALRLASHSKGRRPLRQHPLVTVNVGLSARHLTHPMPQQCELPC